MQNCIYYRWYCLIFLRLAIVAECFARLFSSFASYFLLFRPFHSLTHSLHIIFTSLFIYSYYFLSRSFIHTRFQWYTGNLHSVVLVHDFRLFSVLINMFLINSITFNLNSNKYFQRQRDFHYICSSTVKNTQNRSHTTNEALKCS